MKISVIIPVYNAANFLEKAAYSALAEPEVAELILVDDGSADNTLDVCKKIAESDMRVKILTHPDNKNRGVSAARNLGINSTTCLYIAFLDADDYYLPGRFETTNKIFLNDTSIDGVYEMTGALNSEGKISNYSLIENIPHEQLFENLAPVGSKCWFHINGLTVKKNIFLRAGLFDESLSTSEDTYEWFKMAATSRLIAGNILAPVSIKQNQQNSLTADIGITRKNLIVMLFKLYQWLVVNKFNYSKKEIVLERIIFGLSRGNYKSAGITKWEQIKILMKIFIMDPVFTVRSKEARIYFGNCIGFNQLHDLFEKKRRMLV